MHVYGCRRTRQSADTLNDALAAEGYSGTPIIWGYSGSRVRGLNGEGATRAAVNKRLALERMRAAGVPVLLTGLSPDPTDYPVIARPDFHTQGRHMYVCGDARALWDALGTRSRRRRPTHVQKYRPGPEYRVHVVGGKSIQSFEQGMPGRVLFPPQDGQVVGVR